jgi:tetratricopeptide (TPR) repeat protein
MDIFAFSIQKVNIKRANSSFERKEYFEAINQYLKAYEVEKSDTEKGRIMHQIGLCYYHLNDYKKAEKVRQIS